MACSNAIALPFSGIGSAVSKPNTQLATSDIVFEELIGRQINAHEEELIQQLVVEVQEFKERPQVVSTIGGLEIMPIICGQFKANLAWIKGVGGEVNPCFDPISGRSYVMRGASFSPSPNLSSALQAGVYVGPASLEKYVDGQYGFISGTKEVLPWVKAHGQVSVSLPCLQEMSSFGSGKSWSQAAQQCQFLAMGGIGFSFEGVFSKLKSYFWPSKKETANTQLGGIEWTVGIIFTIVEHPWYERIRNGVGIVEAFEDVNSYVPPTPAPKPVPLP